MNIAAEIHLLTSWSSPGQHDEQNGGGRGEAGGSDYFRLAIKICEQPVFD